MGASAALLPGIDAARVTPWLLAAVPGAAAPLRFARIGDGKSNLTYRVDDSGGRSWVLRRPPLGRLAASAHDVMREQAILRRLAETGVPVPRIVAAIDDRAVCEAPLVLMEHVAGAVLDTEERVLAVSPAIRHAAGRSLAATLASVHAVDLDATGLADLASHRPYAPRQVKRWLRQWGASATREAPIVAELAERLQRGAPEQSEVALVHGDFHLLNMIVDAGTGKVRAVLDWELSTLGDPLADLGSLMTYWPDADEDPGPMRLSLLPGFPTRAELIETYAAVSGRDVGALAYWHALGTWKLAVILEGVRRRRLDEPDNGEPIAAAVIDGLLERAAQIADGAGI